MNEPPKDFEELRERMLAEVARQEFERPDLGKALAYVHERIDQLIRQTGIEVGLLELKVRQLQAHTGIDPPAIWPPSDKVYELAKERFWAADDAAADNPG